MKKVVSMFAASALTISLSGAACAADDKTQNQRAGPTMHDQGAPPAELSKQEQLYLAALKKCEGMEDEKKQDCIEQTRQKHNM